MSIRPSRLFLDSFYMLTVNCHDISRKIVVRFFHCVLQCFLLRLVSIDLNLQTPVYCYLTHNWGKTRQVILLSRVLFEKWRQQIKEELEIDLLISFFCADNRYASLTPFSTQVYKTNNYIKLNTDKTYE